MVWPFHVQSLLLPTTAPVFIFCTPLLFTPLVIICSDRTTRIQQFVCNTTITANKSDKDDSAVRFLGNRIMALSYNRDSTQYNKIHCVCFLSVYITEQCESCCVLLRCRRVRRRSDLMESSVHRRYCRTYGGGTSTRLSLRSNTYNDNTKMSVVNKSLLLFPFWREKSRRRGSDEF
jgi:hypothetical protein